MTEMKGPATLFAQLDTTESLHSRVTRALALQVIQAERNEQQIAFPNEAELCKQVGVSRSILREAVKVLENKGMVQVRPRSGTRSRHSRLAVGAETGCALPARPVRSPLGD